MKSRHYKFSIPEHSFQQALEQLKKADALIQPPAALQNELLQALRKQKVNSTSLTRFWMKAAALFLFSLIFGSIWILKPELRKNDHPQTNNIQKESLNGYMPLTYGLTPEESVQRVRVTLPRSALNDFGISLNTIRSDEVTADVLVGESGLPYAIRVVQKN